MQNSFCSKIILEVLNFSKTELNFYLALLKYESLFFFKTWNYYEFFFISDLLKFNYNYLSSPFIIKNFIKFYNSLLKNLSLQLNFLNSLLNSSKKVFLKDFVFIFNHIGNSLNELVFLDSDKQFFWSNIFFKKNIDLDKIFFSFYKNDFYKKNSIKSNYSSFRALINVSLYMSWSFLNLQNIPAKSIDFRLLTYLNIFLFWINDLNWSNTLPEFFIWNIWNPLYRWGKSYSSIQRYQSRNNFIFFPIYYFPKIESNLMYSSFLPFLENNKHISDYWLNSFFYNEALINKTKFFLLKPKKK